MSGGHFDYIQHRVDDCVDEIVRFYKFSTEDDRLTQAHVDYLRDAAQILAVAADILHTVDYFISNDNRTYFESRMEEREALLEYIYSGFTGELHPDRLEEYDKGWEKYEKEITNSSLFYDGRDEPPIDPGVNGYIRKRVP